MLTMPVDEYHRISLAITDRVNKDIEILKARAAAWEPRPFDRAEHDLLPIRWAFR